MITKECPDKRARAQKDKKQQKFIMQYKQKKYKNMLYINN